MFWTLYELRIRFYRTSSNRCRIRSRKGRMAITGLVVNIWANLTITVVADPLQISETRIFGAPAGLVSVDEPEISWFGEPLTDLNF